MKVAAPMSLSFPIFHVSAFPSFLFLIGFRFPISNVSAFLPRWLRLN